MKVAFIIPSLENTGPIVFTKYLIGGLLKKKIDVTVFYFKETGNKLDLKVPCFNISFFDLLPNNDYDIIHSTAALPNLFMAFHKRKLKGKLITSTHSFIYEDLFLLYNPFKAFLISIISHISLLRINNIIVSSKRMLNYYEKILLQKKKIEIIPYGISEKIITPLSEEDDLKLCDLKNKYTILGACGLLIKRKGFKQLIPILLSNPSLAILLIGNGPEYENLYNEVIAKGLKDRFIFLGFKNNHIDYYKYFDIYMMTSSSEGFGLAMLDAISLEIPIVCSNLEIYKDYFTDDDVCYFKYGDFNSLNNAVKKAIDNSIHFSEDSRNLFKEKFSLEKMADLHINFYKNILNL